ncbi:LAFE_0F09230g1_1 [Lachancea fermentati]|uniref:LAFE_0F09230g1_1 n=1 Tax=Lachancea fermentati TaxID=4955 RepID=A0A1G4MF61_LACFM|nr:LAFE_0F09230g1_1 [Lachancea fermentati]
MFSPLNHAAHATRGFRSGSKVFLSNYSSSAVKLTPQTRRLITWKRVLLATAVTGTTLYYTNDTAHSLMRHIAMTGRRIGVVTQATVRCLYHYQKTLDGHYDTELNRREALKKCHKLCADITLRALESNGGIYIKLGQHIGALTYLLPVEWTDTMIPLQDKCPQSTLEEINDMFRQDLKVDLKDMFIKFDPEPIGVASLAQVHTATLRSTGERVAVKCQHPSLKEFVPIDVLMTQTVFNVLDFVFPDYPLTWLSDELQNSIYVELDFTKEAENSKHTAEYFSSYLKETALRIPKVVSANKRILVMEYLEGHRLDDPHYLDENHISRAEVSSCLSHIFNNMIFTPNVGIHCDPHGGNLAIRYLPKARGHHNFEIILYDHGLYRYPTTETRRNYAKFWLALLDNDEANMKKYAMKFANIKEEQFPLFAAAITGRSIDAALSPDITKPRSDEEIRVMTKALTQGTLFVDLMGILSKVPRIVLLILKTNDLTRHLDECLNNPLGPERTFLILSQYCARTVYDESRQKISHDHVKWSLQWILCEIHAWWEYERRKNQLVFYDIALWWRRHFQKASSV